MRFREILKEYNQAKTAQVFGNKLVAALASDNSSHFPSPLGTSRNYLRQKDKIGSEVEEPNKQIIIKDILTAIEQADPTPNKEYTQWLAKCYANEAQKLEDITSKGTDWLKVYHQFKVKKILPEKLRNIANIKFSQLHDIVSNNVMRDQLDQLENAPSKDKGKAQVVFDNSSVRIIVPNDEAAACYYGQGTRWCTAAKSNNMYDRYASDGDLYILLPKQPKYDGEKYQLHFESGQFMDEGDNPIDSIIELLDMRFGNLVEFFREREPAINDWLVFTPDEILKPLLGKIKQAVNDHLWEMVGEWEIHDDYWYDYLREKGYVYPEGHPEEGDIDFEAVADADESYTSWNYEASDFISTMNNLVDITPQEVRDLAETVQNEYGATQDVSDLDNILVTNIKDNIGRRDSDGGVPEWITDHIYLKKRDGEWDVSLLYTQKDGTRKEYPIN